MFPETVNPLLLADLVATKLSHDLAGLCGILVGALEIAADEPEQAGETVPLAYQAAQELGARLRLLRAAWGQAAETMDATGLLALANGLPGAHRLTIDVSGLVPGLMLPAERTCVMLNALLLAAETLPVGGLLRLSGDQASLSLVIEGNCVGWPGLLPRLLDNPDCALDLALNAGPRGLQAPYLSLLAQRSSAVLTLGPARNGMQSPTLQISWPKR